MSSEPAVSVDVPKNKMLNLHALFHIITYMVCSSGIMFANKLVLTVYRFPSFMGLALMQTLFTLVLLQLFFAWDMKKRDRVQVFRNVFPLSFCYAVDITMGIAGTGVLSLPLFSALRRVSNFFILFGEQCILGTNRPLSVYLTVGLMVLGAAVAAFGDITFDPVGYTFVFINNFSTAGKVLLAKSRLRDKGYSSAELLYYNSAFMIPFLLVITFLTTDVFQIIHFPAWTSPLFLLYFLFSCCSAVLLNYSMLQCTHYTSALTASIVGVIKNVIVTYAGMFVGGDYVYTATNFIGVTISAIASALYVAATYRHQSLKSIDASNGRVSEQQSTNSVPVKHSSDETK